MQARVPPVLLLQILQRFLIDPARRNHIFQHYRERILGILLQQFVQLVLCFWLSALVQEFGGREIPLVSRIDRGKALPWFRSLDKVRPWWVISKESLQQLACGLDRPLTVQDL